MHHQELPQDQDKSERSKESVSDGPPVLPVQAGLGHALIGYQEEHNEERIALPPVPRGQRFSPQRENLRLTVQLEHDEAL